MPVMWSNPAPYGAVLATPFTIAFDVLTAPIHMIWIFESFGGHGEPWLWWCDD